MMSTTAAGTRPLLLLMLMAITIFKIVKSSQNVCVNGKNMFVSLDYRTNSTGHPKLNMRLEQPASTTGNNPWRLEMETGTTCGPDGDHRELIAATLYVSPTTQPQPPPPPAGYTELLGFGLYRSPSEAADWLTARAVCARDGARLWLPDSAREVEVLLGLFLFNATGAKYQEFAWHDTNDMAREGSFVTDEGVPLERLGFARMQSGQPDGGSRENCMVIIKSSLSLGDVPCNWKLTYFCKIASGHEVF